MSKWRNIILPSSIFWEALLVQKQKIHHKKALLKDIDMALSWWCHTHLPLKTYFFISSLLQYWKWMLLSKETHHCVTFAFLFNCDFICDFFYFQIRRMLKVRKYLMWQWISWKMKMRLHSEWLHCDQHSKLCHSCKSWFFLSLYVMVPSQNGSSKLL